MTLEQLTSTQRSTLETAGAVWIPAAALTAEGTQRHLFLSAKLIANCDRRVRVAKFLEDVLVSPLEDLSRDGPPEGIDKTEIASAIVSLWGTESLWIDGLGDNRDRLLFALGESERPELTVRIVTQYGLTPEIAQRLLREMPRDLIPILEARSESAGSCCERAWAESILANHGIGIPRSVCGCEDFPRLNDSEREAWESLKVALAEGSRVDWETIQAIGCWE